MDKKFDLNVTPSNLIPLVKGHVDPNPGISTCDDDIHETISVYKTYMPSS